MFVYDLVNQYFSFGSENLSGFHNLNIFYIVMYECKS